MIIIPELVEVETTKRDLEKLIVNKTIRKISVLLSKVVLNKKDEFTNILINNTIRSVKRRGKWLLFEMDNEYLVIHFRMEGRFYLLDKDHDIERNDYVIFYFDDFSLHYNDPRQFGNMRIISKDKLKEFFTQKKLGLEYDDINLDGNYLKSKIKNHGVSIKNILLDQSYITGIGNIYADEILFLSKINPKSKASSLSKSKLDDIIKNTKIVFEKSLKYKGTYPNIDKKRGTFEEHLLVHKRKDKKCFICGDLIRKEKVASRGTYYCSTCQKMYY